MIEKLKAAGASEVKQEGASWREADAYLREVVIKEAEVRGEEGAYVHPFDHPVTWEGHASLIGEIEEQMRELGEGMPDVVVNSVGGGGLFNGICQGIEGRHGWEETQVLAMETLGADSLAQALEKGELVTLPGITSAATSLGATRVSERTFELAKEGRKTGRVRNAVFTDAEAAMGCWRFADDERILVELACGVSVVVCYGGRLKRALGRTVSMDEKVVIIVCGGSNVSTAIIEGWRKEFGDLDKEVEMNGRVNVVPSSTTAPQNGVAA
jgi:L-serine/L-threonine ammonia-lyase